MARRPALPPLETDVEQRERDEEAARLRTVVYDHLERLQLLQTLDCPVCKHDELVLTGPHESIPHPFSLSASAASMIVVGLGCERCGNVRFFSLAIAARGARQAAEKEAVEDAAIDALSKGPSRT